MQPPQQHLVGVPPMALHPLVSVPGHPAEHWAGSELPAWEQVRALAEGRRLCGHPRLQCSPVVTGVRTLHLPRLLLRLLVKVPDSSGGRPRVGAGRPLHLAQGSRPSAQRTSLCSGVHGESSLRDTRTAGPFPLAALAPFPSLLGSPSLSWLRTTLLGQAGPAPLPLAPSRLKSPSGPALTRPSFSCLTDEEVC